MSQIIGAVSFLVSVYMLIIFVRIILTWFQGMDQGGFQEVLAKITDPYLNWFRRFPALRIGYMDLSPIVALGVLSLFNRVLGTLAAYGTISLGIILALILQAAWGAVAFFLGFLIIILILRLIAQLFNLNGNSFWYIIESISRPVLYRINRFIFNNRIVNFTTGIIVSLAVLVAAYLVLNILVFIVSGLLVRLPI
ncbi:MAG: YggT family protein [Treponema sp.]|nr:YggT family protein [Treponema sp.]